MDSPHFAKKLSLLILSNMAPSPQKPYAGIFVINQFNKLTELLGKDAQIALYTIKRTFTSPLGSILKYLKAFLFFTPHYFKKYDVIHLHYFYPMVFLCYVYKQLHPSCKIVATFHGSDVKLSGKGNLNKRIIQRLAQSIDYTIAVGKDLALEIEAELPLTVHTVLSAGVDERIFYKVETEKIYDFIFVGSFIHRKGVDILIEAIKVLNDQTLRFCFVGSGEYEEQIVELAKTFNITLHKNIPQSELRQLYCQSKFFVFPSRDEPFGLVATEALYCGVPAIVSTNGGLKEQIIHGENGFFLYQNTPNEIVDCLRDIRNMNAERYEQMSAKAVQSNKLYSLEKVCLSIITIYSELTKNQPVRA